METQSLQASWAPPARLGSLPSARPSSLPRTICYTWPTTPRALGAKMMHAFSCQPSDQDPDLAQVNGCLGSRDQTRQKLSTFPYRDYLDTGLCRAEKWPKCLGLWHSSS